MLFLIATSTRAEEFERTVDEYFVGLRGRFERIAMGAPLKETDLKAIDRYFVRCLKNNQTFHSFIMTNSKGIVVSEVVRGTAPGKRVLRDVSAQGWFSEVKKTDSDHSSFFKSDENGRYYLFWAKPVKKGALSGGKRFVGAVAAKIDLWDCFHRISRRIDEPFFVRLGPIGFYSHLWRGSSDFTEETLLVPGAELVKVWRLRKTAEPAINSTAATTLPMTQATPWSKEPVRKADPFLIVWILLVVILVLILTGWLISHLRRRALLRRIDRGE